MMAEKDAFGELSSKELEVGDIVEWRRWNSNEDRFDSHYGVLLEIKNRIKSNRLVSVSRVIPLHDETIEKEFFTLSLKLVSRGSNNIDVKED
jgi:ribosomal protein L19